MIAEKHGIAKLIVTHIRPDWDEKKSEIEENIRKHYKGQVIVADDGTRITL
jgi:ribonuclease BN (tRNA processing enzyme)